MGKKEKKRFLIKHNIKSQTTAAFEITAVVLSFFYNDEEMAQRKKAAGLTGIESF